ncbi:hypothetical protein QMT40_003410 [Parvibaculaceae bacterium PLY_AMNH_Bact1]|nr:hypothetical protein QMT40_003410 [Parvibaculaceae bacterium PLY_AMNH_Bact1]
MLNQSRVADRWIFLSKGVTATEQTWDDGTSSIARFFEQGDFCTNLTSAWTREIASDDLVAITDVAGMSVPDEIIRHEYLQGGEFGRYIRLKLMEGHLFAKELICAKNSSRISMRYQFLERFQPDLLDSVSQKDIARFLGVTPQGLNRFLRQQKSDAS